MRPPSNHSENLSNFLASLEMTHNIIAGHVWANTTKKNYFLYKLKVQFDHAILSFKIVSIETISPE